MKNSITSLIGSIGLLLVAIAIVIPILSGGFPESPTYKIIYTVGALICLVTGILTRVPSDESLREKRWARIEAWSGVFFCVGAFFLWYPGATPRDWLAFTLAGAVIRIIVFFRSIRKAK